MRWIRPQGFVRFARARVALVALLLLAITPCAAAASAAPRPQRRAGAGQQAARTPAYEFGPEMVAYLGFIDSEEEELRYHLDNGEITADDYRKTSDRLNVTREVVSRIAREREDDVVPELYVLPADEVPQVYPAGVASFKKLRAGARLDETWIYQGAVRRKVTYYILERTGSIKRAGPEE